MDREDDTGGTNTSQGMGMDTFIWILLQKIRTVVQFLPPHSHIGNAAEDAIRTFKNHFVAGLVSVEKKPIYLWCRIVKKA